MTVTCDGNVIRSLNSINRLFRLNSLFTERDINVFAAIKNNKTIQNNYGWLAASEASAYQTLAATINTIVLL